MNSGYKTGDDYKIGDDDIEDCVLVPWKLKPVLVYKGTLVSFRLPRTGVSLKLPRYSD